MRRGFTLVELMVVVAIVAVLLVLVGPSMRELIAAQRVRGISAELATNLQFARSEAARRNTFIFVRFSEDTAQTCYTVFIEGVSGGCDCRLGAGSACSGGYVEIRTVSVPRSLAVSMAASSSASTEVAFGPRATRATLTDFQVDVSSGVRGQLRTTLNAAGRTDVCSPDGSITQVRRCG